MVNTYSQANKDTDQFTVKGTNRPGRQEATSSGGPKEMKLNAFNLPDTLTIEVDSREKYPIMFPAIIPVIDPSPRSSFRSTKRIKIITERVALKAGDYRIKEYPACCIVERKAGQLELLKNLFSTDDSVRQAKAFMKLSLCQYPVLLIEVIPADLTVKRPGLGFKEPEVLMSRISMVAAKYGLNIIWMPWRKNTANGRRLLGTFVAQLMLGYALKPHYDVVPHLVGT